MKKYLTLKNQQQEIRLFRHRLLVVVFFIAILCFLLILRLAYLQIIQGSFYDTQSRQNSINLVPIPPARGLIYDRNGLLLVENIPVFSLEVTPSKTTDLEQELQDIQKIIPLSDSDLQEFQREKREHRPFQDITLKLKLSEVEIAKFAVNRYRFPGFSVQGQLIRSYPFQDSFAAAIGYVGRINAKELSEIDPENYADTYFIGKTGIEKFYEDTLHGQIGYQRVETDAHGQVVRKLDTTPSTPGKNLYLTIDANLQQAAKIALNNQAGAIVAIDPNNGQVLAMVSQPNFDPNLFVQGISQADYQTLVQDPLRPLYNRTVRGLYPTGSTIKPFIGLEGLDSNTITPDYKIFDPGWYKIPGTTHIFHDWQESGHGWVNIQKAITVSCDTYFFNLAYNLGITPIDSIATMFGFGQKTGIDLPHELAGTIPSPDYKMRATGQRWYPGDTVNSVIGQGFWQATPLQLASAAATLAMHGVRYQPTLVYGISQGNNPTQMIVNPPHSLPPVILKDPNNWDIIINAMQQVIPFGTGYAFGRTPYTVAAKTGTAQVISVDLPEHGPANVSKFHLSNSMFIAFAPVDHPQIAIEVTVEHAPGAAAAVARKVIDYYLITEKHWQPTPPAPTASNKTVKSPIIANTQSEKTQH